MAARRGRPWAWSWVWAVSLRLRSRFTGPLRPAVQYEREAARATRQRSRRHQHAGGVAPFDRALHAQPCRERDTVQRARRRVGKIERHHAKTASLQHKVERFQCACDEAIDQGLRPGWPRPRLRPEARTLGPAHRVPTNPQQPIEIHPRSHDRRQVKTIEGIDERRNLAATRRRGKHLQQQRGSPRRVWTRHVRELPTRKPAAFPRGPRHTRVCGRAQTCIETGERRRSNPSVALPGWSRRRERAIQRACAKRIFEDSQRMICHSFALGRKYIETRRMRKRLQFKRRSWD